jgi:hypothetical protein
MAVLQSTNRLDTAAARTGLHFHFLIAPDIPLWKAPCLEFI